MRSLLVAADVNAAIAGSRKGVVILAAESSGGGNGGIRTGLKSRRYLLVAVTSFNSYQFYSHTSLPGRYNGDFGAARATASAPSNANDKYLIVREKEVYWTSVETASRARVMAISSLERRSLHYFPIESPIIHAVFTARELRAGRSAKVI